MSARLRSSRELCVLIVCGYASACEAGADDAEASLADAGLYADAGPTPTERDASAPALEGDPALDAETDADQTQDGMTGDVGEATAGPADAGRGDSASEPAMSAQGAGTTAADASSAQAAPTEFEWNLPRGFPMPYVPKDNPMSAAKVELGRRLFYDKRLSGNETQSCASCHQQALAFTDGRATGLGSTGEESPRGSPGIVNLAYSTSLTWANPLFAIGVMPEPLERQTQIPMYGDTPIELGLKAQMQLLSRLEAVPLYRQLFADAYPDQDEPLTAQNVGRALAAFERAMISGDSPYDHFIQGDESALSEAERRGYELFTSDRLSCSQCHSGFNLSEHVHWEGKEKVELVYRNTGLYNIDGEGAYPEPNTGAFNVTMNPDDMGKFKVPTLRNVALTAPYMHDGSLSTLSDVIDHYAAGGRTITDGPYAGVGRDNPLKDPRVHGFEITQQEREDLIAFLGSLTDESFVTNPAFSDPWLDE